VAAAAAGRLHLQTRKWYGKEKRRDHVQLWQMAWRHRACVSTSTEGAVGEQLPSCRIPVERARVFSAHRRWGARFMQCALGHGWFGAYRQRFNLSEDIHCPCSVGAPDSDTSDPIVQTRDHLLYDCPRFAEARRAHITDRLSGRALSHRVLFSSRDGIPRLLDFLSTTDAFSSIRGPFTPHVGTRAPSNGTADLPT
jgi:hypothetical protein